MYPNGKYDIILADPPWKYNARRNRNSKFGLGVDGHYPTMSTDEIKQIPVGDWAADNSVLFLWVTFPRLRESLDVIDAWGFEYKTVGFVWVKTNRCNSPERPGLQSAFPAGGKPFFGTGFYTKSNAEVCLLATRGKVLKPATDCVSNIIIHPIMEHSRKPDTVQYRIEAMYPDTKRLEMFARRKRDGWEAWGNEVS